MKHIPVTGKVLSILGFFGAFAVISAVFSADQMQKIQTGYLRIDNSSIQAAGEVTLANRYLVAMRGDVAQIVIDNGNMTNVAALAADRTGFDTAMNMAEAAAPADAKALRKLTIRADGLLDNDCSRTLDLGAAASTMAQISAAQVEYLESCSPGFDPILAVSTKMHDRIQNEAVQAEAQIAVEASHTILLSYGLVLGGLAGVMLVGFFCIRAWIVTPVQRLQGTMRQLAEGDMATPVHGLERRDEIGSMARAVAVFRDAAVAKQRLEAEVAAAREAELAHWASRAELAEKNRTLLQENYTDSLTGVANRRCFDDKMREAVTLAAETGTNVGLILLDIDHFKAYNDFYGHMNGDDCLRLVAGTISGVTRAGDLAARYGGEEFAIIMPGATLEATQQVAERMREAVAELAQPHAGAGPNATVTISLGAISMVPAKLEDIPLLIETADSYLYTAKRGGRNRVVVGEGRVATVPQM